MRAVALYAGKAQRSRRSHGVALVALADEPRSFLSTLPMIFKQPNCLDLRPWGSTSAGLAVLLLGVPALLAFAVDRAARGGGGSA